MYTAIGETVVLFVYWHNFQVIAQESLTFKFIAESDLWIYVLEPGDEFFLHLDFWPEPMQPIFRVEKKTNYQDVAIHKTEIHKHENCQPISDGRYVGKYMSLRKLKIILWC